MTSDSLRRFEWHFRLIINKVISYVVDLWIQFDMLIISYQHTHTHTQTHTQYPLSHTRPHTYTKQTNNSHLHIYTYSSGQDEYRSLSHRIRNFKQQRSVFWNGSLTTCRLPMTLLVVVTLLVWLNSNYHQYYSHLSPC